MFIGNDENNDRQTNCYWYVCVFRYQGYQMLKDGKLYGSIIPSDVHTLRIQGLSLGDSADLQILALTDHPVGRTAEPHKPGDSKVKGHTPEGW